MAAVACLHDNLGINPVQVHNVSEIKHSKLYGTKYVIGFIECFTTTFLRAHSWLNWVDDDDDEDEVGLKDRP